MANRDESEGRKMSAARDVIDERVRYCRRNRATSSCADPMVIVALADERDECVELLRRALPLICRTWKVSDEIEAFIKARYGK